MKVLVSKSNVWNCDRNCHSEFFEGIKLKKNISIRKKKTSNNNNKKEKG
jgi:hypothetical protein